ncbi:hypothetical protein HA48_13205 [Pantoea wallisii]|uniref:Iron-regulated membrane protein n=1 Tax=Pantoea wallisii TaxID=1076551 RepID=A0A1X1D7S8_9GAMM|nr:DUF2534 family protein [Pantoea wallisii]ORM72724.1 hypothetical protein HA48_13205 [Pantoea wallisii]
MSAAHSAAPRGAVLNLLRRLHFYIGLFVAPFIFVAALSGTLYVLTPQLENLVYADALTVQPHGTAQPLSAQITAARAYAGDKQHIYAVRPAPGATDTTRVQFSDGALGASQSRAVFIDPYSLAVKGDMTVYGTSGVLPLRTTLDLLHSSLLLGDPGRNYSELAASWLWVAALGGVLLWLGTRPKRQRKPVRSGFAFSRHWHITLGLVLLTGLLFFSVTGLTWSQWAGANIDKMRTELNWLTPQVNTSLDGDAPAAPADPHADHHSMPGMDMSGMSMSAMTQPAAQAPKAVTANAADGDWDRVLNVARENGIDATKLELRQPKRDGQAWTVTEIDRSWPTQVDAVSINPQSFAVVDHVWFDRFPLVAKLTRWGVDAHMGVLFGVANQLLLALFGLGLCGMIVLGYRMWWIRRPKGVEASPAQTLTAGWLALPLYAKGVCLALAVALGYALPVMGISLLAFVLVDILRWRRQQRAPMSEAEILAAQQSPLGIIRARFTVKRKEMRYFLRGLFVLALVVGTVMSNAIIGGVIDQYGIPFSHWSLTMYLTQGFMIALYTMVFTGLMSIPLWYFFLGEKDDSRG